MNLATQRRYIDTYSFAVGMHLHLTRCALQRERVESLLSSLFSRYNAARRPMGLDLAATFFFQLGRFATGLFCDSVINSQR